MAPDLVELAQKHGTDKYAAGVHYYARHYQGQLQHLRDLPIKLLEIGIGGYEDIRAGGGSLRMWKEFFPNALIYGLDIFDKRPHDEERIRTIVGDQSDVAFLERMNAEHGPFDVIIDDGSHVNTHVITTLKTLFPLLAPSGVYVVEDLQTSYWPDGFSGIPWGGCDSNPIDPVAPTAMNCLKSLVDCLNHAERLRYVPSYFDLHITAIAFFHNICFIQKGENDEPSNFVPPHEPPRFDP